MENNHNVELSKEERKRRLFGQEADDSASQTVTLMGHWNNDSGCRLN